MTKIQDHPNQLPLSNTLQGPLTYEEIGRLFGVTSEAIRQCEAKALQKIRRALNDDPKLRDCLLAHLPSDPRPRQDFYKVLRDHGSRKQGN